MKKKLLSIKIELRAIRTISVEPESRAAREFLAKLSEEHFAYNVSRIAYKRIKHYLRTNSTIPSWDELCSDPAVEKSVREVLEDCDYEPITSKKRVRSAIDRLQEYRKLRMLTKIGKAVEEMLSDDDKPLNADKEIEKIQSILTGVKSSGNFRVLRIGQNSNVMKQVEKLLKGESIVYVPTGFSGFDSINRGIPLGSVMLVAGPTGTGKSALLAQLMANMAMSGAKAGTVPLEMSNSEMLQRHIARVSSLDMTKLLDPQTRLKKSERQEIYEKFAKYDKKIAKAGGSLEYYEFDDGVNIEQVTATVEPFELDVLGIDYLGLLEGTSGERQWQYLMDTVRYLHIWCKSTNTTGIAAAQLSEDGMLRYSKGMAEHAKFFWSWKVDDVARQTGLFEIEQRKARQASDHSFMLHFDLAKMTIKDATKDLIEEANTLRKQSKEARKDGKSSGKRWKDDLSWDEDSEELPEPKPGRNAQKHVKKSKGKSEKAFKRKNIEL